ncbi:hypothetical protein KW510_05955 [Vibrio fluvialis]|nr:hypothetical protein [Vibrio fluvialis]
MNIDLKNNLIMALVGAVLASGGFLATDYFETENKKNKFVFEIYKSLYDEGASKIKDVNKKYSELYELYAKNFGLTPEEIKEKHKNFRDSLVNYSDYIDELVRYGNSEQVEVAKSHMDWLWGVYAEFDLQFKISQQVKSRAKNLLMIEDVNSEQFNFVNEALESDIERLVRNENRIFYAIGSYKMPVVNGIEQYVNYQFRESLGISATIDMAETIKSIPSLIEKSNQFKFEDKKLPFMFAEGRAFQSPTLEFEGDTEFFSEKNDILAKNIKMKFIASVIENDKNIQKMLE